MHVLSKVNDVKNSALGQRFIPKTNLPAPSFPDSIPNDSPQKTKYSINAYPNFAGWGHQLNASAFIGRTKLLKGTGAASAVSHYSTESNVSLAG